MSNSERIFHRSESFIISTVPVRSHLSELTKRTLGTGNLRKAVELPEDEELNEWLLLHADGFYTETYLLYHAFCLEGGKRFTIRGAGYPPGIEYRWHDPFNKIEKPIRCTSPQYVQHVFDWILACINNPDIFPQDAKFPFPNNFRQIVAEILKRLFRVFVIMILVHKDEIVNNDGAKHTNTVFKHFMFFVLEFSLIDTQEFKPLKSRIDSLKDQFDERSSSEDEDVAELTIHARSE